MKRCSYLGLFNAELRNRIISEHLIGKNVGRRVKVLCRHFPAGKEVDQRPTKHLSKDSRYPSRGFKRDVQNMKSDDNHSSGIMS